MIHRKKSSLLCIALCTALFALPLHANGHEEAYLAKKNTFTARCSRFLKKGLPYLPILVAAPFITYDIYRFMQEKRQESANPQKLTNQNSSFVKKYWKGLAGLGTILCSGGISWALKRYNRPKIPATQSTLQPGLISVKIPQYNRNGTVNHFQTKQASVGERIVEIYRVPQQQEFLDCGYRSLFYAKCLMNKNLHRIFDPNAYNDESLPWKNSVNSYRKTSGSKTGLHTGFSKISAEEMENVVIKKHIRSLRAKHYSDGMREVHLKTNVAIIENLPLFLKMLTQNPESIAGPDHHAINCIKSYRNGKSQIVIVNTAGAISYRSYRNRASSWHFICCQIKPEANNAMRIKIFDPLNHIRQTNDILSQLCYIYAAARLPA